jgi:hypothetical protein
MRLLRGAVCAALVTAGAVTPLLLLAASCIGWRPDDRSTPINHPTMRRAADARHGGATRPTKSTSVEEAAQRTKNRRRRSRRTRSGESRA